MKRDNILLLCVTLLFLLIVGGLILAAKYVDTDECPTEAITQTEK